MAKIWHETIGRGLLRAIRAPLSVGKGLTRLCRAHGTDLVWARFGIPRQRKRCGCAGREAARLSAPAPAEARRLHQSMGWRGTQRRVSLLESGLGSPDYSPPMASNWHRGSA
jgi:hypothetical protein